MPECPANIYLKDEVLNPRGLQAIVGCMQPLCDRFWGRACRLMRVPCGRALKDMQGTTSGTVTLFSPLIVINKFQDGDSGTPTWSEKVASHDPLSTDNPSVYSVKR